MRVSYDWYDHECYFVKLNFETVGMLFKTFEDYWTFKPFEVKDDELNSFFKGVVSVGLLRKTDYR